MKTITLYRASDSDIMTGPTSFAAAADTARAYLDNPGFGGRTMYSATVTVDPAAVLDIRGTDQVAALTEAGVDCAAYGAATVDWILAQQSTVDSLVEAGYQWVRLLDTFPIGAETWTWLYAGDEPEMEEIDA